MFINVHSAVTFQVVNCGYARSPTYNKRLMFVRPRLRKYLIHYECDVRCHVVRWTKQNCLACLLDLIFDCARLIWLSRPHGVQLLVSFSAAATSLAKYHGVSTVRHVLLMDFMH